MSLLRSARCASLAARRLARAGGGASGAAPRSRALASTAAGGHAAARAEALAGIAKFDLSAASTADGGQGGVAAAAAAAASSPGGDARGAGAGEGGDEDGDADGSAGMRAAILDAALEHVGREGCVARRACAGSGGRGEAGGRGRPPTRAWRPHVTALPARAARPSPGRRRRSSARPRPLPSRRPCLTLVVSCPPPRAPSPLPSAPRSWSWDALAAGAVDVGLPATAAGALPGGGAELVWHVMRQSTEAARAAMDGLDLGSMSVNDRVRAGALARTAFLARHRKTWPGAMAAGAAPGAAGTTLRLLAEAADEIWYLAGGRSTDLTWYSRRALLAGVLAATEVAMLTDASAGLAETADFLDRRLVEVTAVGRGVGDGLAALAAAGGGLGAAAAVGRDALAGACGGADGSRGWCAACACGRGDGACAACAAAAPGAAGPAAGAEGGAEAAARAAAGAAAGAAALARAAAAAAAPAVAGTPLAAPLAAALAALTAVFPPAPAGDVWPAEGPAARGADAAAAGRRGEASV